MLEDPTRMVERTLAGEADTVHGWTTEFFGGDGEDLARILMESGAQLKQERKNYVMNYEESSWSSTEIDPVPITCPNCGEAFEFGAWTLVNASENPEAVQKIIDGSICEFVCLNCGYDAHLAHPCLFIDPDRKVCIYSVIDDDMEARAVEMFNDADNDIAAESTCRIVRDRFALAEKVLIFTQGLDDRPIELLKFAIRGSIKLQGLVAEGDEVDVKLVGFDGGDILSFSIMCGEDVFTSDMEMGAMELFANALNESSIADEEPLFVDPSWGSRAIDAIQTEGTMD